MPQDVDKLLFVGDTHHPYQDEDAIRIMLSFARWFQPDFVYLIGDIIDMYSVSKYGKDPSKANMIQKELDSGRNFLKHVRAACPNAKMFYKDGNHEHRMVAYKRKNPEIASLTALTIPSLLSLDEFGMEYQGYQGQLKHGNFIIEHGDRVSQHSATTAKNMFANRFMSGISGHTHRMGAYHITSITGTYTWYENGCLCKQTPEYMNSLPNWQTGFSVGYYLKGQERMVVDQIPIRNQSLFYQGKLFQLGD